MKTQPQINGKKTVDISIIETNYTAALSAFRQAARLKGLYIERIVTVPYVERKKRTKELARLT